MARKSGIGKTIGKSELGKGEKPSLRSDDSMGVFIFWDVCNMTFCCCIPIVLVVKGF